MSKKSTPVHRIKRGGIEVAIWENDGKTGPFHSVTFKRSYQTADGSYKDSHAYTLRDMRDLARCVLEAHLWMEKTFPAQTAPAPAKQKKAS